MLRASMENDPHHPHLRGGNFWKELAHPFVEMGHGHFSLKDVGQALGEIVAAPIAAPILVPTTAAAVITKHVLQDSDFGPAVNQVAATTGSTYAAMTLGPAGAAAAAGAMPIAMAAENELVDSNLVKKAANYFSPF